MDRSRHRPCSLSERTRARRELLDIADDVPVVITVARLDRQKRSVLLPEIIMAAHRVIREDGGAMPPLLIVLGDGDEREAVEARIQARGLDERAIRLLCVASSLSLTSLKTAQRQRFGAPAVPVRR